VGRPAKGVPYVWLGRYPITVLQRDKFLARLKELPNGCVVWTGCTHVRSGHGRLTIGVPGRETQAYAHRVAWALIGGEVPPGFHLMHNCPGGDNPECCNIDHLIVGTQVMHGYDRVAKDQHRRGFLGLPRGVYYQPNGRFGARFDHNHLGTFDTPEEATAAYAKARREYLEAAGWPISPAT
jgi:HNH endonuclease/AP2 domain